MTLKLIKVLSVEEQSTLRYLLEQNSQHLTIDHSRYAPGRRRFWLQQEADLREPGKFTPGVEIPELWTICSQLYDTAIAYSELDYSPKASLGLAAYGSKGIDYHRDATYADYPAVSINLSTKITKWGYEDCRLGYTGKVSNKKPLRVEYGLLPGAVVLFNCKNPHAALDCDEDRWSVNLWSINPKLKV
jgi:hypothetical protein